MSIASWIITKINACSGGHAQPQVYVNEASRHDAFGEYVTVFVAERALNGLDCGASWNFPSSNTYCLPNTGELHRRLML